MNLQDTITRLRADRPAHGPRRSGDDLLARIVSEPGDPRFGQSSARRRSLRYPRLLAGGSLGLAGIAAALVLAFSGGAAVSGGTASQASAFTITRQANGNVLVHLATPGSITAADYRLQALGIKEQVDYTTAAGPAASSAAVACRLVLGPGDSTPAPTSAGPQVSLSLGTDGSGTLQPGNSGGGQVAHTVHLASCVSYPEGPGTELGNSGYQFLRHYGHHGA